MEAKIEDRVYNVVAFCAGTRLDRDAEERTYGTLGHGVCNRGKKGHSGVTKESRYRCAEGVGGKNWPKRKSKTKKRSQNPDSQVNESGGGRGGGGYKGGREGAAGMKIKATPWGGGGVVGDFTLLRVSGGGGGAHLPCSQ